MNETTSTNTERDHATVEIVREPGGWSWYAEIVRFVDGSKVSWDLFSDEPLPTHRDALTQAHAEVAAGFDD